MISPRRPRMLRVRFENVGRDGRTWTADLPEADDRAGFPDLGSLCREAIRGGALMSRMLSAIFDPSTGEGWIYVGPEGAERRVGRFVVGGVA